VENIDTEANRNYELGIITGLEMASEKLFNLAIESFKRDEDIKAKELKKISKDLEELSLIKQKKYDKDYPKDC